MNKRLKKIRLEAKMNQAEFSKSLGIGQSTLAMMEVGKREISERHIKTICAIFGIRESWFRDGEGEMKNVSEEELFRALKSQFDSEDIDIEIIRAYMMLPISHKKPIREHIKLLVDHEYIKYVNKLDERQKKLLEDGDQAAEEIFAALSTEEQDKERTSLHKKLDEELTKEKKQELQVSSVKESDAG